MDYIVFASPSSVDGYVRWGLPPSSARMLSIGPSTSAALRAHGLRVHREAAPSTLTGLLVLLRELLCPRPPR